MMCTDAFGYIDKCAANWVDSTTLVSLLQQCGNARALSEGKRVHACIIKLGYGHDTFLANLLVQMYGKCGSAEEAYLVFTRMQERDVFSWNMMIQAYAQNGHLEDAKGLFDITPEPNVVSWTTMITAYGQNGYMEDARRMFEEMPQKNRVSWNAMISAYAQNGYTSDAIELFQRMLLEGERPSKISLISALAACAGFAKRVDIETMHANIVESGFQSDATVATALINLLGKCGKLEAAESAFGEIAQHDVFSRTAMISAYAQSGQVQLAKSLFDGMPQRDVAAWNAMVTAYAQNGHMPEATNLFKTMPQRNVVSWSTMVAANAQYGHTKEAITLFCRMDLEGISPNKITFLGVLDACGDAGSLEEGKLIHAELVENGLELDVCIGTALVSLYGKCGRLADTKAMFDKIPRCNVAAWTALVTAYAQSGHWKQAVIVFHSMVLEGVKPNEITFVSLLSACSRGGHFADAWHFFAFMDWDYDVRLTREHYVCMIDLLGRAGNLNEADDLIHNMPFQPCVVSWNSLLSACNKSYGTGNGRASHVAKQLADLDSCNSLPYVLLSNIHAQGMQSNTVQEVGRLNSQRP